MKTFCVNQQSVTKALLLFIFVGTCHSATTEDLSKLFKFEARVTLDVTAEGALESIVRSYISRNLRGLDGVVITDDDADYRLSVIVIESENKSGTQTGYGISSVGLSLWKKSTLESAMSKGFTDQQKTFVGMFAGTGCLVHHLLQIGATEDLEDLCSTLVASFDTNALEPSRNILQGVKDNYEKTKDPVKR